MQREEKKKQIADYFLKIMEILGVDFNSNPSMLGTPNRVAKMYVDEIFSTLNNDCEFPKLTFQNSDFSYTDPVIINNIKIFTTCEHHFLPFFGLAKIAYIPNKKIIGLSKINRIVKYFCKKPQLQEKLTLEILNKLKEVLDTEDVAVYINASHLCINMRGVEDANTNVTTTHFSGVYKINANYRSEFLKI